MKEILVISGKGGTGKTTIVGSFAVLADNKALADCDVDAPNLHLLLRPEVKDSGDYFGGKIASIDAEKCLQCGTCAELCRFDAIRRPRIEPLAAGPAHVKSMKSIESNEPVRQSRDKTTLSDEIASVEPRGNTKKDTFRVDALLCEGCGVCFHACPHGAVSLADNLSGKWYIAGTVYGPFVYARLGIAAENSGKLVAQVREKAGRLAGERGKDLIINDGPPGIGCPVVASLSGIDLALIVTEPTVAGIHDLVRIIGVADHFGVKKAVCINKYDLDEERSREIERYCTENKVALAGKICYDPVVSKALAAATPLVNYAGNKMVRQIIRLWQSVENLLAD